MGAEACELSARSYRFYSYFGAFVEGGGWVSPRRARYFSLLRQRKVPQRKAPPSLRPLRGNLPRGACGVPPQNSLRACSAPFGQLRRVRARGRRASTRLRTPQAPRHRRSQQGVEAQHGPSLRSAPNAQALRAAKQGRAQRCARGDVGGFPSVCAWGAQGAGWHVCRRTHMLRELTHRSCPSGAPQARSEFCGAPRDRAPQVAP